jgi:hypothetical protein
MFDFIQGLALDQQRAYGPEVNEHPILGGGVKVVHAA